MLLELGLGAARVATRAGRNELGKWNNPEHVKRRAKLIGASAIVLVTGGIGAWAGNGDGLADGVAVGTHATHTLAIDGGTAEIRKIDPDFKQTCWTASTIDVTGSNAKVATNILGIDAFWRDATVNFSVLNKTCISPEAVTATRNSKTGDIVVTVDKPESITTDTSLIPDSAQPSHNGAPLNNLGDALTQVGKGIPGINDFAIVKIAGANQDKGDNSLTNIAIVDGMHKAVENCAPTEWPYVEPSVEKGLKAAVMEGALLYDQDPTHLESKITVMVADKKIKDIDANSVGKVSNIDPLFNAIQQTLDAKTNLAVKDGSLNACKMAADVSTIPSPRVLSTVGGK